MRSASFALAYGLSPELMRDAAVATRDRLEI